ncbi:unnamed protein product [Pleuronectes platessa]|uniref:Uncharacterized protein n=1 Tax=Pleuronectes platessa TaxID=8262 RepID=A0A9N7UD61_PLEPL|nr:unnamed protein product [Pleuronectes platessa]
MLSDPRLSPMSPLNGCSSAWLPIRQPTPLLSEPRDRWVDMGTDRPGAPQPASQPGLQLQQQPASQSFRPGEKPLMLETTSAAHLLQLFQWDPGLLGLGCLFGLVLGLLGANWEQNGSLAGHQWTRVLISNRIGAGVGRNLSPSQIGLDAWFSSSWKVFRVPVAVGGKPRRLSIKGDVQDVGSLHPLTPSSLLGGSRASEDLPTLTVTDLAQDRGQRGGTVAGALFTQLWGSPGPGEREDVFRASLIMAASEEINRQGPAGMLQLLLLLMGGLQGGGRPERRVEETADSHTRGYTITLALWFHICTAAQACKSTFLVWPDANRAHDASA